MKFFSILIVLAIGIQPGCKKNEHPDNSWGEASALKNGQSWNCSVIGGNNNYHSDGFNLNFRRFQSEIPLEEISIINIRKQEGISRIYKTDFQAPGSPETTGYYLTNTYEGDVICDIYHILSTDSSSNFINVEDIDNQTNKVRGSFSLKLLVDTPKCNPAAPDTLTFTNGIFYTKIK